MRWIALLFALLITNSISAQPFEMVEMHPIIKDSARDYHAYIPYNLDHMPVKRVRLVVHIIGKDDGSGNFQNRPQDRWFLERVFNHLSCYYSMPDEMRPKPESYTYLHDTRIRFVIDTILFHRNTDDADFYKYTVNYNPYKKDSAYDDGLAYNRMEYLHRKYVTNDLTLPQRDRDSALHIFFLECGKYNGRGMASGTFSKNWVFNLGTYHDFKGDSLHPNWWGPGMNLAHEIGHAFGLEHVFDYHRADDIPVTERGLTNDVMDTWPNIGSAFSPAQIGIIHWGLSGDAGEMHDILIPDWQEYHPDSVMHLTNKDTVRWYRKQFLWGDLVIHSGTTLIVRNELYMPPGSMIRIKAGGSLIVDGGVIRSGKGLQWEGVRLASRKFLCFERKSCSKLLLIHNGKVRDAKEEVRMEAMTDNSREEITTKKPR